MAGLIFSKYQTGNRTFQNGGCGGDRGLQTFSSKHKAILVQATKAPTLSLVWTCETIWEDQRKLLNMKTVFLVRTSPKRLGPYCQDLGPIFSQYGPRTRSIRYMYCYSSAHSLVTQDCLIKWIMNVLSLELVIICSLDVYCINYKTSARKLSCKQHSYHDYYVMHVF